MSLSRWKMMAGVLGVSIGGLAAAASQCPKFDKSKGRQPEEPVAFADVTKLPPAGAPSAPVALPLPGPSAPPAPELPKLPDSPSGKAPVVAPAGGLPPIPDFPPPGSPEPKPAKTPDLVLPASAPPALPSFPAPTDAKIPAPPASAPTPPKSPVPAPVPDAPKIIPSAPTGDLFPPAPDNKLTPLPGSVPPAPPTEFAPPSKPVVGASGTAPTVPPMGGLFPASGNDALQPPKTGTPPALPIDTPKIEAPVTKPETAPVAATKYRIVLRVGEGEPTFEVKNGDDLVLKVACEKVDIKSPEKGAAGLSAVTARGKVRFAGFGVEGTCTELSFMAGTGEVSMSGEVKVQMKDKLGRVESELTTTTLKYKIDANAVGASIKP